MFTYIIKNLLEKLLISTHAINNNYLLQPGEEKKSENLFRSDMQEVAYFSTKITSFCNQTFYPDIAKKMVLHKQTHALCTCKKICI